MDFIETKFRGVFIISPDIKKTEYGEYIELFNQEQFSMIIGNVTFVQENESFSKYGVIRAFHFQNTPMSQAKLVRVAKGQVNDVIIDLRKDSSTYGQFEMFTLSADNHKMLFIPKGFAHGFCAITDDVVFQFKCDNYYCKELEVTIPWDDPDLQIDWGISPDHIIVSDNNNSVKYLSGFNSPFVIEK